MWEISYLHLIVVGIYAKAIQLGKCQSPVFRKQLDIRKLNKIKFFIL